MKMDTLEQYFDKVAAFILEQNGLTPMRHQNVIKQHTDKLPIHGDFGFPITLQAWLNFAQNPDNFEGTKRIIERDGNSAFIKKLIEFSSKSDYPIERVKFQPFRCLFFLNREKCFGRVLKTIIFDDPLYGRWVHSSKHIYNIEAYKQGDNCLTEYRCAMIAKVLINLVNACGFETLRCGAKNANVVNILNVLVTCGKREAADDREEYNNNNAESRRIICGAVRSRRSHSVDDFIELRCQDMARMAELKYGTDKENLIPYDYNKLGAAIVRFDLLKSKHINPVDFDNLYEQKSTIKGAAFVLYNVARLQKLLSTFDSSDTYSPLPALDEIDFSLLKEEEEWQMLYVYVIGFPLMLERCIGGIDNGIVSIHLLCTFLNNLAASFSVYYHRIKILTENLPHLMPVLFARIYLLKALRIIFIKALSILEIESLNEM